MTEQKFSGPKTSSSNSRTWCRLSSLIWRNRPTGDGHLAAALLVALACACWGLDNNNALIDAHSHRPDLHHRHGHRQT